MKHHEINLCVFGAEMAGKTAIIDRKTQGYYIRHHHPTPTYMDNYRQKIKVGNGEVILNIVDTCVTEPITGLRNLYMKSSDGFILVYSINNHNSFEDIRMYYDQISNQKESGCVYVPIIVVGNKNDLEDERQVTLDEGKQLAEEFGINFIECSAKEYININELFETIALDVINNPFNKKHKRIKRTRGCLIC
ncbi:ras-related protein Rap-1b [Entamoeba marina]